MYNQIGTGVITLSDFTTFMKNLKLIKKDESIDFGRAALLYLGIFGIKTPIDKLEQELQKLGVWDSTNKEKVIFENKLRLSGAALSLIGRSHKPVFPQIYMTLEELRMFAEK